MNMKLLLVGERRLDIGVGSQLVASLGVRQS